TIGPLIRDLRKTAEVSQWDLANQVNVSQAKLSLFESGHRELNEDELMRVTDALHAVITERWVHLREKPDLCSAADAWIAFLCEGLSPQAKKEMHLERGWPNAFSTTLCERAAAVNERELKMLSMIRKLALWKRIDDLEQQLAQLKGELAAL
ncbi:MAG TPA: helix-turn-helix transcriptional regulator, partial [Clostridia bacterium]|nr:helix-turn-helix transcriptional regulator [Clostridia bacterium]